MKENNPRPSLQPRVPHFSSGPCAKRPGWTPQALEKALIGRSHRSLDALEKFKEATGLMREVLQIPQDYQLIINTGSNSSAFEMALWNLLGPKGVDIVAYEAFGRTWQKDVIDELKLSDVRSFEAKDGELPDLHGVDFSRDVVFVWVGTPTCVSVPGDQWIPDKHEGLVFCDAVSVLGVTPVDWQKFDAVSFSWQKVFGGEAAHGICVLSPRALERLEHHKPTWPLPRIFRLRKKNAAWDQTFLRSPINTISMLALEDCIDAFTWAKNLGGMPALKMRAQKNHDLVTRWVETQDWIDFLVEKKEERALTCTSLKIVSPHLSEDERKKLSLDIVRLLSQEGVAFDIKNHEDAPSGLRFWTGPTVESTDLEALFPWIEWAYREATCTLQS